MRQLGVQMHGVTLNLQCNYDKLLEHTADLLARSGLDEAAIDDLVARGVASSEPT